MAEVGEAIAYSIYRPMLTLGYQTAERIAATALETRVDLSALAMILLVVVVKLIRKWDFARGGVSSGITTFKAVPIGSSNQMLPREGSTTTARLQRTLSLFSDCLFSSTTTCLAP
jgi:hypothetical protein